MINSINTIQNIYRIHRTQNNANPVARVNELKGKGISGDELALSDESRIKQKALQALKNAEDIRSDRVDLLREQIASGTYQVSDDEVAEKMVTDSVLDILL